MYNDVWCMMVCMGSSVMYAYVSAISRHQHLGASAENTNNINNNRIEEKEKEERSRAQY